jgi:dipeptidyl aminopeptidase/acylaminoacyl peptidase
MKKNYNNILLTLILTVFCIVAIVAQNPEQVVSKEIGNLVVQGVSDIPATLSERFDQYLNTRSAGFSGWDSEGKGVYIATRFGDVAQIHHVADAGQSRQQLTFFKEPVTSTRACPDTKRGGFLFGRDQGGNEVTQYYWFDPASGKSTLVTDGKSRHGGALWNKKGTRIAYSNYRRNGKDLDFFIKEMNNLDIEIPLIENEGNSWKIEDWSADDKWMVISKYTSVNQSDLYLLEVENKKTTPINPSKTPIAYGDVLFSKDNKGLYWVSDQAGEFQNLYYYDLAAQKMNNLTAQIPWDISGFNLSNDGKNLVFTANEDGYGKLYLLNTSTQKWRVLEGLPQGLISGARFNADNRRIGMTINSYNSPSDVYVYDLKKKTSTRWTNSETGGLNPTNFVAPQLIRYPSFDGREIPAFLYLPKNATGKTPVVIEIHGGPEGQSLPAFNAIDQFWVNELGIAVLVPNVRGSTGYGKTYVKLDNGFKREDSVKDIGALLDWIGKQNNLDATHVGVYGGSYGGYMSLACMTNYNDRLRCGVDLFGISNFVTFLKNTGAYRQDTRRAEYGDEREPDMAAFQTKISPLNNIDKVTKPMFIYQGKNDPRVPLSESEQMRDALRAKGNAIWYVMAKDEGHGIAKKPNRDYTQMAIALFFEQFLK